MSSLHCYARTNSHIRGIIQKSELTNTELASKYGVNKKTISKWRNRDYTNDKSSKPKTIHYALSNLEKEIIRVVRTLTWMDLDDLVDCVSENISNANRSNVYRTLRAFNISRVPQQQKDKAKKFKEYEPGYLHIDVTYLPKLDGCKYYLFVAIFQTSLRGFASSTIGLQDYFTIRYIKTKQLKMQKSF